MFRQTASLTNSYLYDHHFRQEAKKQYQVTVQNVEKIKKIAIKKIRYPDFKEAYDYVDNLFPAVKVKDVVIFKVAARSMERMGYGGVEGFYDTISKSVVVSAPKKQVAPLDKTFYIHARVSRDEVIVHELCHYCYVEIGQRSDSSGIREEFAYGWSIGYLRQNEHSDEFIIKYNFLPHLLNMSYGNAIRQILAENNISVEKYNSHKRYERMSFNKRFRKRIFLKAKKMGMEEGWKIMKLYSKKLEKGTCNYAKQTGEKLETVSRFDLMDL